MAKKVLIDAWIEVDGTELSNHFSAVALDLPDDEVDLTGFGSRYREIGRGLKDASIIKTGDDTYCLIAEWTDVEHSGPHGRT